MCSNTTPYITIGVGMTTFNLDILDTT